MEVIMDYFREEMIKHLVSAIKDFKIIHQALWLNGHRCDPPPYKDGLEGFLKRAKERIYSAKKKDLESAYDECVKSGIKYPNGSDILMTIGNKAATPEDKERITDLFYGMV